MPARHHLTARHLDHFSPTCPTGASWYACAPETGSTFVGCCGSDPCATKNGCSQGNIRPVSYNASSYGTPDFPPDAACPTGSNFYTCASGVEGKLTQPTFWGCCKTNVCSTTNKTCPDGNLVPAYLGSPAQVQAYTGEEASPSPSSSPSPSPSPSSSPSSSPSPSASQAPADSNHKSNNTAVIVGGGVGGVVVVVLIVCILIFCLFKKRRARSRSSSPNDAGAAETSHLRDKSAVYNPHLHGSEEAPPTYTSPNPNQHAAFPLGGSKYHYSQIEQQPQAFPVELPSSGPSQAVYSELPAEQQRTKMVEMESPVATPRPIPTRFEEVIPHVRVP